MSGKKNVEPLILPLVAGLGAFAAVVSIYSLYRNIHQNPTRFQGTQDPDPSSHGSGSSNHSPLVASNSRVKEEEKWLPAYGMDAQYQNRSVNMNYRHPVLAYQMSRAPEEGIVPASIGDALRPPDVAGPSRGSLAYVSKMMRPDAPIPPLAWTPYESGGGLGPYVGDPRGIGVPVPSGSLKRYNERYRGSQDFGLESGRFVGSVDAYAPFPEIGSSWEKAGILTSKEEHGHGHNKKEILNLFRRPIAPGQDLWEYQVQDKNGFIIKLESTYLEDHDTVRSVIGKSGSWRVHIFTQNKYIWV
jgi:hypothetical protein